MLDRQNWHFSRISVKMRGGSVGGRRGWGWGVKGVAVSISILDIKDITCVITVHNTTIEERERKIDI